MMGLEWLRPAAFFGSTPLRDSSSSITLARSANGTAPLIARPLMKIAGVPVTQPEASMT